MLKVEENAEKLKTETLKVAGARAGRMRECVGVWVRGCVGV